MYSVLLQNMMVLASMAKCKAKQLLSDETGEVNIVATVVLIGIAVLLALFFKDQVMALLTTLFQAITKNATDAVNGASGD